MSLLAAQAILEMRARSLEPGWASARWPLRLAHAPAGASRWIVYSEAHVVHEIAKLILEHAETLWERSEAVSKALYLGMPLNEIEAYLDWLAMVRGDNKDPPPKAPDATDAKE